MKCDSPIVRTRCDSAGSKSVTTRARVTSRLQRELLEVRWICRWGALFPNNAFHRTDRKSIYQPLPRFLKTIPRASLDPCFPSVTVRIVPFVSFAPRRFCDYSSAKIGNAAAIGGSAVATGVLGVAAVKVSRRRHAII
jgi:hypothetical protein